MAEDGKGEIIALTAEIVAAHVGFNRVGTGDLPELIATVHGALAGLGAPAEAPAAEQQPAVAVRSSVKPGYIVCLEDGKKLTMLKRYLQTRYAMTPQQYRAKWKLPADYPMVAPDYAERRRALAKEIGLGRKSAAAPVKAAPAKAAPGDTPPAAKSGPAKRTRAKAAAPGPVAMPARRGRPKAQ